MCSKQLLAAKTDNPYVCWRTWALKKQSRQGRLTHDASHLFTNKDKNMSTLLQQLNNNLSLQMQNIMSDNPSAEELKAISEQTKQLTSISKQIIDNHRLILDAAEFNYNMGNKVDISDIFTDVSDKKAISHG